MAKMNTTVRAQHKSVQLNDIKQ